ncbi:PDZ domain-containing protein [Rhodobacterales bacterium HKCCE3408]|nr:PDZ domain-containing protein [Rhodobacterales bacterium HKCCE3408]
MEVIMSRTMPVVRGIATATLVAALGTTGLVALAPTTASAIPPGGYADLIEQINPAVVRVEVSAKSGPEMGQGAMPDDQFMQEFMRRFGGNMPNMPQMQEPPERIGVGSGFIITGDGMIVTNYHVVDGADTVTVTFADGTEHQATVIGGDPLTDIALLDVDGEGLPTVSFGSSAGLRVGDEVIAIGHPFGLGSTVTTGIVSAMDRDIHSGPFDEFIQTDAAINRGNSGGPLFNDAGEVIGVNTAIFSPNGANAGIGFAIPADQVSAIIADLEDDGRVERGWLGVQIRPASEEVAQVLGLHDGGGVVIEEVIDGTPAAAAGLESGDIVLGFNGISVNEPRDLTRAVAEVAPGTAAQIEVLRHGEHMMIDVTLADRSAQDA